MARGEVQYFTGTIPANPAGGVWKAFGDDIYDAIEDIEVGSAGSGVQAWVRVQDNGLTGPPYGPTPGTGNRNYVYMSRGDTTITGTTGMDGDTRIYARVDEHVPYGSVQQMRFTMFQSWEPTTLAAGTGLGGQSYTNNVSGRNSLLGYYAYQQFNDVDDTEWYLVGNEYEVHIIAKQGGTWGWAHFGQPNRSFVSPSYAGVGFTTAAQAAAGGPLVLNIDRDLTTTLTNGQQVWIMDVNANQAATGALGNIEIVTITTVAAGAGGTTDLTITAGTTVDHEIGALVGWDPSPVVVAAYPNATGAYTDYWYTVTTASGGQATGVSENYRCIDAPVLGSAHWASYHPGIDNLYYGTKVLVYYYGSNEARGIFDCRAMWAEGAQVDGDLIRADGDINQTWKVFPSLQGESGLGATMIGMGAGPTVT